MPVVCLPHTSKTLETLIPPAIATKNQTLPNLMGGIKNQKFSINGMDLGLEIYHMCESLLPLILPMVVPVVEVVGGSTSWDPKKIVNEYPLNGLHKILLVSQSEFILVHTLYDVTCV